MFTIIGAMAELESALISERVTAGMKAAKARGKHLGRPPIRRAVAAEIEALAASTNLSIRQIHERIDGKASRGIVGEITKRTGLFSSRYEKRYASALLKLSALT
jgi:DNA invertase Pin-like site-specific DNA recombinase